MLGLTLLPRKFIIDSFFNTTVFTFTQYWKCLMKYKTFWAIFM